MFVEIEQRVLRNFSKNVFNFVQVGFRFVTDLKRILTVNIYRMSCILTKINGLKN